MEKILRLGKSRKDYDIHLKSVNSIDEFISNFENNVFFYNNNNNYDSLSLSSIKLIFPKYFKKTIDDIFEVKYNDSLLVNLNNLESTSDLLFPLAMVYISFNQEFKEHRIEISSSDFLEDKIYLADSNICGKIKQVFDDGKIRMGYSFGPGRLTKEIFR
jgi:hypothetical protein